MRRFAFLTVSGLERQHVTDSPNTLIGGWAAGREQRRVHLLLDFGQAHGSARHFPICCPKLFLLPTAAAGVPNVNSYTGCDLSLGRALYRIPRLPSP
ncbi:MAG: hypothetical protein DMG98_15395 [Acidobacteria bacterium]|nr:MAG: hypothetical protein DMG98_15395 [Acidobacteriota bacterium]